MNPTPNALALMEVWIAAAKEVLFGRKAASTTGQNMLNLLMNGHPQRKKMTTLIKAPKRVTRPDGSSSLLKGEFYTVDKAKLNIYRLGFNRFNSLW